MKWLEALTSIATTIGIRFLIPIVMTIGIIYALRKLDARWQAEAEAQIIPATTVFTSSRCYDVKKCSPEQRANCSAADRSEPCWQVFRQTNGGLLKDECLSCGYFFNVPTPVRI